MSVAVRLVLTHKQSHACNANLGKRVRKRNAHRFHNKLHFCVHKQRGVPKTQVCLVPQAMSQLRPTVADREHRENPRWAGGTGGTGLKSQGYFSNSSGVVWVVFCFFFLNFAPAQSAPSCLNMHQSPSIPSATRNRPAAPCARLMKETEEQSGSSQGGAEAAAPN